MKRGTSYGTNSVVSAETDLRSRLCFCTSFGCHDRRCSVFLRSLVLVYKFVLSRTSVNPPPLTLTVFPFTSIAG